jgi:hypothetical protein
LIPIPVANPLTIMVRWVRLRLGRDESGREGINPAPTGADFPAAGSHRLIFMIMMAFVRKSLTSAITIMNIGRSGPRRLGPLRPHRSADRAHRAPAAAGNESGR